MRAPPPPTARRSLRYLAIGFVILPLKGLPAGGGFALPMVLEAIVLHAGFGLGVAIVFRFGRQYLADRRLPSRQRPSPTDQEGDRLYRPLGRVRIEHEPAVVRQQHHPVPAAQGAGDGLDEFSI